MVPVAEGSGALDDRPHLVAGFSRVCELSTTALASRSLGDPVQVAGSKPLAGTAADCPSGDSGKIPDPADRLCQHLDRLVNLLDGVVATDGEAKARPAPFV